MKNLEYKVKRIEKWLKNNEANLQPISNYNKINKPVVTIQCIAYNHEKYIAQCLDSFLMQKVNFDVEIIVHDDCSSDSTRKIIDEYKNRFPQLIRTIYEKQNICSGANNYLVAAKQMTLESRGTYIALCDGDDYWTDPYKLFKQVLLMKSNQDASFCCHKVKVVNEKLGHSDEGYLPKQNICTSLMSSKKFLRIISERYSFQTGSYFFKTEEYKQLFLTNPNFIEEMPTDDEAQLRYFGAQGSAIYINKDMSVYRHFSTNSWSDKKLVSKEQGAKYEQFAKAVSLFDEFSNFRFHKSCLISIYKPLLFKEIQNNNLGNIFKNKNLRLALRSFGIKTFIRTYIKYRFKI